MADIEITFVGFRRAIEELGGSPTDLRRVVRPVLSGIGREGRKAYRAQFAGRLTDRSSRRRTDSGTQLGTFSGDSKRSIGSRVSVPRSGDYFQVRIGPRGRRVGIMVIHEHGLAGRKKRATAAIADALIRPDALRRIEQSLSDVLRGW